MTLTQLTATIIGATGYTGGELLRLLTLHPSVGVTQVTSRESVGRFIHQIHPHLRGQYNLKFISEETIEPTDILFLALPHGQAQQHIERYANHFRHLIDLSADFRLSSSDSYQAIYDEAHQAPDWLNRFTYGLPEINRDQLQSSQYASGVGCNAAATILALWATVQSGLVIPNQPIMVDLKVGSSEAGSSASASSHHPARSGIVRPFQLTGHRHEAEVIQALAPCGDFDVRMAISSVEMVRGVSATVHLTLPTGLSDRDFWQAYRTIWNAEPFVRIVHERGGIHRHPEPRLLAGTNFADVGWEYNPETGRTVLVSAIDNLGKGASGSAVQSMNLMCGFEETTALTFGGIYP